MKPVKLLRAAAVVAGVQFAAHSILFLTASPRHGPEEIAVVDSMRLHRFPMGGFSRSYWDLYFGYGLMAALNVLVETALLWQLARLAERDAARVRPLLAVLIFANLAHAALCLKFFFLTPVVPDAAIAALLGAAMVSARRDAPS